MAPKQKAGLPLRLCQGRAELRKRPRNAISVAALCLLMILGVPSTAEPQEQQEDSVTVIERGTPGVDGWDVAEFPFKVILFPLYLASLGLEWLGGAAYDGYPRFVHYNSKLNRRGVYATMAAQGNYSGTGAAVTLGVPPGQSPLRGFVRGGATFKSYWLVEGRLGYGGVFGWEGPDMPIGVSVFGSRRHRPQDEFYGIGNDSDEDDRSDYKLDIYEVTGDFAVFGSRNVEFLLTGGYEKTESGEGDNELLASVDSIFGPLAIPGFGEEQEYVPIGVTGNVRVGRRHALERGGYWVTLGYRWNHSETDGAPDFGKLTAGAGIDIPFDHGIRSLNLAISYESLRPRGDGEVAFYYLPALGGPRTLPAYRARRFRDRDALLGQAEYRYRLWDSPGGSMGVDATIFAYGGMVAQSMSDEFSFDALHPDVGMALRLLSTERPIAYLSVSAGDEGVRVNFTFRLGL